MPGISNPEFYYRSVTAHGTAMGYVFPTLVAMGFGYAISEAGAQAAADRPALGVARLCAGRGRRGHGDGAGGAGTASVLYTFYPPMIGNPFYYIGVVLVVVGSWIWVALMSVNLYVWKRDNPGRPVPLAMFANVAGAYLWGWTAVGAALEILFQIIPVALGLKTTIDAGLARVFFSWTLHAIVYFWLMPDLYRLLHDHPARDRRASLQRFDGAHRLHPVPRRVDADRHAPSLRRSAGRLGLQVHAFGLHRPVALPTLLTVFTICASVEIASRLRGGKGAFGWIAALPWHNPMMLAAAFSFVMLGFGGAGGIINMSYQLDSTIHNTQWITGHFHLIFGGAIVIMYFAIAYDLWPHLTGRALRASPDAGAALALVHRHDRDRPSLALCRHSRHAAAHGVLRLRRSRDRGAGVFGDSLGDRRIDPGGIGRPVLHRPDPRASRREQRGGRLPLQRAVHEPARFPSALNSFGLWLALMIGLTLVNYGYPIAQLMVLKETNVPAVYVGTSR